MPKPIWIGAVVLVAILAALFYFSFYPADLQAPAPAEEQPSTQTNSVSGTVSVPDVNPVRETNPFSDVKTNPFE
ncbi:hypothetical protein C4552_04020 [Candidatus Parcubacteria bacterium]|nr:MAG: hypothetical protein C4552_04020 [Candidatus Parcubacteria bacterium]